MGYVLLAAILVGGLGKRLKPLTNEVPKCMLRVGNKSILEWQIDWLKKHGFEEIVLLVGYLKDKIIDCYGSGAKHGVKITYVVEDEPLGTGGAVKNAEHVLSKSEYFLVINGDIITDLDPSPLIKKLLNSDYLGVIASVPLPSPYGILEIEGDRVFRFVEKPIIANYWINAGVYALKPQSLKYFPHRGDLERTAFPDMARDGVLGVVMYENVFWKAIDTYKDLEDTSKVLGEGKNMDSDFPANITA